MPLWLKYGLIAGAIPLILIILVTFIWQIFSYTHDTFQRVIFFGTIIAMSFSVICFLLSSLIGIIIKKIT